DRRPRWLCRRPTKPSSGCNDNFPRPRESALHGRALQKASRAGTFAMNGQIRLADGFVDKRGAHGARSQPVAPPAPLPPNPARPRPPHPTTPPARAPRGGEETRGGGGGGGTRGACGGGGAGGGVSISGSSSNLWAV